MSKKEILLSINNTDEERLDKAINKQNHPDLYSRNLIDKLIEESSVYINGKICTKKSFKVKNNDKIKIILEEKLTENEPPLKENIPLDIVYEDEFLAVINKQAGITVHPAPGNHTGTLVNALLYHFEEDLSESEDNNRPGIVHRLDKDTSGLIVIAKNNKIHYELSKLFSERSIDKTYLAISLGVPNIHSGTIENHIKRHPTDRKKMSVSADGKHAVSQYETLIDFEYFSLIKVKILTGRTHQIRVHLESIHHPVIGDSLYNSTKRVLGSVPPSEQKRVKDFLNKYVNRQLLHSYELSFIHPVTQKQISFNADIPEDFFSTIKFLKSQFNCYIINTDETSNMKGLL